MRQNTVLAAAIIKFLEAEALNLSADRREGLQVAASCIRNSFQVSQEVLNSSNLPNIATLCPPSLSVDSQPMESSDPTLKQVPVDSKVLAEKYKTAGNEQIAAKNYPAAAESYTLALEHDPNNAVYYSNRAAAFLGQKDYSSAVEDSMAAISLNPNYGKAYSRLGTAYQELGNNGKALESFEKAAELEPDNVIYQRCVDKVKALLEKSNVSEQSSVKGSDSDPDLRRMPTGMPNGMPGMPPGGMDFASLMNNPEVMNAASQMMKNPDMLKNLMNNPNIAAMMQGMMGGGAGGAGAGGMRSPRPQSPEEEG